MPRRVESKSELVFRTAKPRAQPYLLADGDGLALRVRPNGTRTWLLRYRRPSTGKENFLSLDPSPDVSLIDARKALRGVIPRHKKGHIPAITKPAEITPLVQAISSYKSPITQAALKLTMLTGLRPSVVAAAPWGEMDLDRAEWHVPAGRMKMQHEHIVPLPKQAVALLKELESLTGRVHYVFPSPARQKTPHLHRDALSKALRELGFQGKHAAHGFRGMLRTVGRERLGVDIDVLEAQLAHAKRGDVQKAYDRTTFDDDRRRIMQEWADYIDRLGNAKP